MVEYPHQLRLSAGASSNALNDVVRGVHGNVRVAPVINAPAEGLAEKLYENARSFARLRGFKLIEAPPPRGSC